MKQLTTIFAILGILFISSCCLSPGGDNGGGIYEGVRVVTNPTSGSKALAKTVHGPPDASGNPVPPGRYTPNSAWFDIGDIDIYHIPGDNIITANEVAEVVTFSPPVVPSQAVFSSEGENQIDLELGPDPVYSSSYEMIMIDIDTGDIGVEVFNSNGPGNPPDHEDRDSVRGMAMNKLVLVDDNHLSKMSYFDNLSGWDSINYASLTGAGFTPAEANFILSVQAEIPEVDGAMFIPVADMSMDLSGGGDITAVNIGIYWDLNVEDPDNPGTYGLIDIQDIDGIPYDWYMIPSVSERDPLYDIRVDVTFDQDPLSEEPPEEPPIVE